MSREDGYGIYVHIPFCVKKCGYCDFESYSGREKDMPTYTDALCTEIKTRAADELRAAGRASTLYIGGGTPTALPIPLLAKIIETLKDEIPFEDDFEFTVEANPGTVDLEYMTALSTMGVNRISLGVQSFDDDLLKRIGRIHTAKDAKDAVRWARAALIVDVSVDLMYGLPGQTMEDLKWSVGSAMDLAVTHISVYGLTIEDGTPFAALNRTGRLGLPTEDETADMYDYLTETLPKFGFRRYEISNFARSDFVCRHNLGYWNDRPYFGFGVAAHGYYNGFRVSNIGGLDEYLRDMSRRKLPVRFEKIVIEKEHIEEFCFLALRTAEGISRARFSETFGCSIESVYKDVIEDLKSKGFLEETNESIRLTQLGMKFGNRAFAEFLLN